MADIITLDEYKAFEGKTKTDDDLKIEVIIPAVTNLIQTYLGTTSPEDPTQEITETIVLDYDTDRLYTQYYPIREVTSIIEYGRDINDSTVHLPLTHASDFIVTDDYIIRLAGVNRYLWWPSAPGYVVVTYTAGKLNTDGTVPTVQSDIKLAAIELVSYYLKKEYIQSRSAGGSTYNTYVDTAEGMPPHIAKLLDGYKAYV